MSALTRMFYMPPVMLLFFGCFVASCIYAVKRLLKLRNLSREYCTPEERKKTIVLFWVSMAIFVVVTLLSLQYAWEFCYHLYFGEFYFKS